MKKQPIPNQAPITVVEAKQTLAEYHLAWRGFMEWSNWHGGFIVHPDGVYVYPFDLWRYIQSRQDDDQGQLPED